MLRLRQSYGYDSTLTKAVALYLHSGNDPPAHFALLQISLRCMLALSQSVLRCENGALTKVDTELVLYLGKVCRIAANHTSEKGCFAVLTALLKMCLRCGNCATIK